MLIGLGSLLLGLRDRRRTFPAIRSASAPSSAARRHNASFCESFLRGDCPLDAVQELPVPAQGGLGGGDDAVVRFGAGLAAQGLAGLARVLLVQLGVEAEVLERGSVRLE